MGGLKLIFYIIAVPICVIIFYALCKLQMRAWLKELDYYLNNKLKEFDIIIDDGSDKETREILKWW